MSNLAADLGTAIHRLLKEPSVFRGFRAQFRPQDRDETAVIKSINAAFLVALTGKRLSHPARGYLASMSEDGRWARTARFYLDSLDRIEGELAGPGPDGLAAAASDLVRYLDTYPDMSDPPSLEKYWNLFFPEGVGLLEHAVNEVEDLRQRRTASVKKLNTVPVTRPYEEILFSSNVLITVPLVNDARVLDLGQGMSEALRAAMSQEQAYWYDHPIPVGIETDRNEAVYGLRGLDKAVRFEIGRGNAPADAKVPVLLSVSTTHRGLQDLAHEYLALELKKAGGTDHLTVYAAAEKDVQGLLEKVLLPAAGHYFPGRDAEGFNDVLSVDGEYGRHYSFLKAAAALWHVLLNSDVRATFKIDLDQVFPQEDLVSETGRSAFEHLCDPLWGAEGTDNEGREVEFGMFAGALVNEADIRDGLFTPDVKWPSKPLSPEQWIFASPWPQALSTEAEMMALYGADGPDGRNECLQRVHVTGGTTGIMVEHLRRHRPFTPSWIGRAEDQAYLLPVLFQEAGRALRYAHASGLIMRHDKEVFAVETMETARIGKLIGDCVRILAFTSLARALPWGAEAVKNTLDPFTGCFISRLPVTVACLRMALTAAGMFASGTATGDADGVELVLTGSDRLGKAIEELCDGDSVRVRLQCEKDGWDLFYDVLDKLEQGLEEGEGFAESIREKAQRLIEGWKI